METQKRKLSKSGEPRYLSGPYFGSMCRMREALSNPWNSSFKITPIKTLYRSSIVPPETPGIVSIRLPETVTALQAGALYHWFLTINFECPLDGLVTRQINGWVQRVVPDAKLINLLKNATPEQQAILYAKHGIWFDALTTLGDLRRSKPKELGAIKTWNRLLQSIGLENLKTKPIVNCCIPNHCSYTGENNSSSPANSRSPIRKHLNAIGSR